MFTSWVALSALEKVFWIISLTFSLGFVIQLFIIFLGLNSNKQEYETSTPDMNPDILPALMDEQNIPIPYENKNCPDFMQKFRIFHPQSLIPFFMIFGWTGIAGIRSHIGHIWTIVIALFLGFFALLVISILFYFICKLFTGDFLQVRDESSTP